MGLGLVVLLLLSGGFVYYTSLPRFCPTCHIMRPYFESWKISSHNEVSCTECHYTPGLRNEILAKFEGLSMTVQYLTGTHGPLPWAEVEDASCLRSGCHETRLLEGKVDFIGVTFNHRPHLTEIRRGKTLKCASCHSQIVQGLHITVTESTCFLCHFKEVELARETANCKLCHTPMKEGMKKKTLVFDHGDVVEKGMDCLSCHSHVVVGDGAVPEQRCLSCHNEPVRLERITDHIFLHQKHITEKKIECLSCHIEIRHSQTASMEVLPTDCSTCHTQQHENVKTFYMGSGGRGVEEIPAPMYLAGVDCKGCHTLEEHEKSGELITKASVESCIKCHGEEVRPVYQGWRLLAENRRKATSLEYKEVFKTLRRGRVSLPSRVEERLEDAQHNLALLENVPGIHNISYTKALAKEIHLELNRVLEEEGFSKRKEPWSEIPYETECIQCHIGIEFISTRAFGRFSYPHYDHVVEARIGCERCHEGTHRMGEMKIGARECGFCHHKKSTGVLPYAPACTHCHEIPRSPLTIEGTEKEFSHAFHVEEVGLECSSCHIPEGRRMGFEKERCEECHES